MPKSRGKGKGKAQTKANLGKPTANAHCLTLEENEETRCNQPISQGERCQVHHGQYCVMTKRYKDASKIVDEILGGSTIPTKTEIMGYTDYRSTLEKAKWMRKYVEAIRAEKTGREIQQRRFFLKVDDGHKIRLKLLAKKMVEAVETLDGIQGRAFDLYVEKHPAREWVKEFQTRPPPPRDGYDVVKKEPISLKDNILNRRIQASTETGPSSSSSSNSRGPGSEDDDLIDIELRAQKKLLLDIFESFLDPREYIVGFQDVPDRLKMIQRDTLLQYARRIIFYEPVLSLKALDKVSFKDLILDDDFSLEDLWKFAELSREQMGFALKWWKDAALEAIDMFFRRSAGQPANAANVGNPKDRFPMLGGWIYRKSHKGTMSNEAWWYVINSVHPPANVENRFMRLCNTFDDLYAFLSFGALGLIDPPSFCTESDPQGEDSQISRKHLSLSGVLVADMVSPLPVVGPLPSQTPASRRGYIKWVEIDARCYMFGALRNEPHPFVDRFLKELRARPDLFIVVTHSETDSGQKVDIFGGSPNEIPSQMRVRSFEAPIRQPIPGSSHSQTEWDIVRSAKDVLFGRKKDSSSIDGYLTQDSKPGWLFHFKTFPVKYFAIIDTKPRRHVHNLSRQVAWAALRAQGLATGEYSFKKYAKASDVLFGKHASERLSWWPASYGPWSMTTMAE